MGTLTSLLQLGSSALSADQTALTATAENISNQNTDGYTRRTVNFSTGDSVLVRGVSTSSSVQATVTAQRDSVVQRAVLQATEAANASSTRLTALNSLQSLFAINSNGDDAAGIGAALSGFFSAAGTLAAQPTDAVARQTMYTNAQQFASTMNRAAAQITAQENALNQKVVFGVNQVNGLLQAVADLNHQILAAGSDTDTSSLQDQRDLAISQLATQIDAHTFAASDGSISVTLTNGTPLVNDSQATSLGTVSVNGSVQVLAGSANVTGVLQGGSLGGAIAARDHDLPAVTAQLDAIVSAVTAAANSQNAQGTDANGTTGVPIFSGSTAATVSLAVQSGAQFAASPDGSNAQALAAIASQALVNGMTPSDAFSQMVSTLGQTAATASSDNAADAAVLTQTSTQLAKISGVSLDTEAANLTQYQRSYEAAAKLISLVNELMAQAINLGTAAPVS